MATVYVENRPYQMDAGQNLLHGCLSAGLNLPYFCWHPALGSVGACRQCAVKQFKDENDKHGKIVMACLTPAAENTRLSIDDPEAVAFRAAVIEGLMLNHPHDCPVCDEGGECHLQDMTVMTGHAYRRYEFEKRTFRNQDLGPFVNHEMNRCIQCYRCVRFYRDYAGGGDLDAFSLHNSVFFGRERDGILESEFSGNLVEICPTGVFTDKTLKHHYTRKWDLQFAPSICVHCGTGCNTSPGARYGMLRRIVNRYHHDVNGYFLCDRGRFGYEFVNSPDRIRVPKLNGEPISADQAREQLRKLASGRAIGIGSPRASLESNFALRNLVGADRFYCGMADRQAEVIRRMIDVLRAGDVRTPSLREVELCDAVFIVGEDVTNTAPRIALSLRQSVRRQPMKLAEKLRIPLWMDNGVRDAAQGLRGPLSIATPYATRLDDIATAAFRAAPNDLARLAAAVTHALDANAPAADHPAAAQIAKGLKDAERPLLVSGPGLNSVELIEAAANLARAARAALCFTAPECNTMGAAVMGGGMLAEVFELAKRGEVDAAIVLENDLYRRAPASAVDAFFGSGIRVAAIDSLPNGTTAAAHLILPAATFAESDGTLVSSEGRVQRFFQVLEPQPAAQESWRWLRNGWRTLDEAIAAMAESIPDLSAARFAAPSASFRMAGAKIPREPHRYSGRTAILANIDVSEPKPPADPDSALAFSMEGASRQPPGSLTPFFWSPGWNSIQATNFYQREIGGALRGGDPGVRLFEPEAGKAGSYFTSVPEAFQSQADRWLIVPIHHIFGAEEMSASAPGVAELAAGAYIAMREVPGAEVELQIGGETFRLPARQRADLPLGVAGVPAGIAPLAGLDLPAWGTIRSIA